MQLLNALFNLQIDCKSSIEFSISLKAALSCIEYQASEGKTISSEMFSFVRSLFSFVIYPVKI